MHSHSAATVNNKMCVRPFPPAKRVDTRDVSMGKPRQLWTRPGDRSEGWTFCGFHDLVPLYTSMKSMVFRVSDQNKSEKNITDVFGSFGIELFHPCFAMFDVNDFPDFTISGLMVLRDT